MTEKILFIDTERQSVRAEAIGWSCDDSATVIRDKHIGLSNPVNFFYTYDCVLRAMNDGWKFKQVIEEKLRKDEYIYTWILTKD